MAGVLVVLLPDGRRVVVRDERYARMVRLVLAAVARMDGMRAGALELRFNGASVSHAIRESYGPDWLDKVQGEAA